MYPWDTKSDLAPKHVLRDLAQLLELICRYLKRRPLDHKIQIPFIQSVQFLILIIYNTLINFTSSFFHVASAGVFVWCLFDNCACAFTETLLKVQNHFNLFSLGTFCFSNGTCYFWKSTFVNCRKARPNLLLMGVKLSSKRNSACMGQVFNSWDHINLILKFINVIC